MPMTSGRVPAASRTPGRPPLANLALWVRGDLGLTLSNATLASPNDFDNAVWARTGISNVVANATTDPFGGLLADSLVENGANSGHLVNQTVGGSVATGIAGTWSVYAKAGARTWLYMDDTNSSCYFNLSSGHVGTQTGCVGTITPVGNGWYLCSIAITSVFAASMRVALATGDGGNSYVGDGVSNLFLYGAAVSQQKVAAWADQSGNGRNLAQVTPANQPLLLPTGCNGAPSVAFDGSDDYMASLSFTLPQPYGVWMVANVTAQPPGSNKDVVWATGSNGSFWLIDTTPRTVLNAGVSLSLPYLLGDGVYVDLAALVDGANSVIRADGTPMIMGNAGSNPGTSIFSLGGFIGSRQARVEIAELIILTSPSVTDVSAVETYLQERYNLRPLPFVPPMLPGCVCWLRGDLGITLNGGNVAAWADQSGNGNDAVQATAGNQPAYLATGYDGLPCIDWVAGAVGRGLVVASLSLGQFTMIGAIRADAVSGYFLVHNSDATNGSYIYGIANNALNLNGAGVDSGYNVVVNWLSDGVRRTVSVNYGGTHATHFSWRNGTPDVDVNVNAGEPGSGVATGPLYLGHSQVNTGQYKGVMAEVIVYNRSLSPQELTLVHAYLKSRYGL